MRYATITDRLADLGGEKWQLHSLGRQRKAEGHDVIEMTIGEPDVPTPLELIEVASAAMFAGRTSYSNGRGEAVLLNVLATHYSALADRPITDDQILCFPGTQTALYAALMGLTDAGDEVLVGDPMYATYGGLIAASGATLVPVPLRPERNFEMSAGDIAARVTSRTRVILLNSPHNPTGSLLTLNHLQQIAELAIKHDFWIVSDEVYSDMLFEGAGFVSPLNLPEVADRVVTVSSISKSHAAPGFRSGWCIAPAEFTSRLLPLAETMLFGNQPFIADMTAAALSKPSTVAQQMRQRFARRAGGLFERLHGVAGLQVNQPQAGMFALINIASTGMNGDAYALDLLNKTGVAVMPGAAFGAALETWVRVALTIEDTAFDDACERIAAHAEHCVSTRIKISA